MCGIVKKTAEWNFSNLEISVFFSFKQNLLRRFFLIFPVSSFVCNKNILSKKYGVTGLIFKIDPIDGKKWVTLLGKIVVIKSLLASQLVYIMSPLPIRRVNI